MPALHLASGSKQQQQQARTNGLQLQNGFKSEDQCSSSSSSSSSTPKATTTRQQQKANKSGALSETETLRLVAKKKQLLIEENQPEENNNNNNNIIVEEEFSDVKTLSSNGKFSSNSEEQQAEPIIIGAEAQDELTSIGRSARDQFADALLRLQADLHDTTERLSELATKVDKINLSTRNRLQEQERAASKSSSVFNRDNATTLFYFGWPVVVFFTIRALEKRSLSSTK